MVLRVFHRFLFFFSPEVAHRIVVAALKAFQSVKKGSRPVFSKAAPVIRISTAPKLRFSGRVGLAAGFDKNAEVFSALSSLGFSFLEVGSVTPIAQPGNPKPRIWRVEGEALVNALGFNNVGLEEFRKNIVTGRKNLQGVPLLANLGKGKNTPEENAIDDYRKGFEVLADVVDGFVVNLSSPNTPGLTNLQNLPFLQSLVREVPKDKPVWTKLSPDLADSDLEVIAQFVKSEKSLAGVVVTNTSRKFADERGHERGGLSGAPLFERSLYCVELVRRHLGSEKCLIGVGGINSLERAKKMREAGADLVEIYTGFIYRGPKLVRELVEGLR